MIDFLAIVAIIWGVATVVSVLIGAFEEHRENERRWGKRR